jgi:hypothetical protein
MSGMTHRNSRSIGNAVRILLTAFAGMAAAKAGSWEIGTVAGSTGGGEYSSLRFDKYGNGHVSYADDARSLLQYSFWDHNLKKWFSTTLDYGGFCSLTLDSKGHPHISYNSNGHLKYTYWDGSSWQKQTIPVTSKSVVFYTSIALDINDNPGISYFENESAAGVGVVRLRVVTWNGSFWELVTVDQTYGSGKFNSIASDSAGRPHIAYGNVIFENSGLRYAHWDGTSWNYEILDGAGGPGSARWSVAFILDKQDIPHIAYSDVTHMIVKYATKVAGKWQMEAVDSVGKVAFPDRNGIALDDQGTPYISYYDVRAGVLKVAHRKDQKWYSEVVDSGFAGFTSSLQIYEGTIWLTYASGNGSGLKIAKRRIESPDSEARMLNRTVAK